MDIKTLVATGESETVEFKASLAEMTQILETISAFSNSRGGTIFVGVDDNGRVAGVHLGKKTLEDTANRIKMNTDPPVYPSLNQSKVDGRLLLSIEIDESIDKPVFANDRAFKRVGKTNQRISSLEIRRIASKASLDRWDSSLCESSSIEDLDLAYVEQVFIPLYEKIAAKRISGNILELLESLGCLRNTRPTNSGILLFGKDPTSFFINSYVAIARYIGTHEGPERSDYKEFNGNLFTQIDKSEEYLRDHTAIMSRLLPGEVQRRDIPEYGLFTIRELITNAVCHRDYMNQHTKVIIKIFDERIEFFNPGGLPKGITPENIQESQFSRNPIIAKVLSKVRYIEELGEGWNKILEEHKYHPLNPDIPTIQSDDYTTQITIYSVKHKFERKGITPLSARQRKIVDFLQKNNTITSLSCRELIKTSQDTALRELNTLRELGVIEKHSRGKATTYSLR